MGNKLRIFNGRVTGDLDGNLTSYQYNGASTVDYGIVSEDLQKNSVRISSTSFDTIF